MRRPMPSDPVKQAEAFRRALEAIEAVTTQLPISQTIGTLAQTLDWLLDEALTEERWRKEQESYRFRFARRWHAVCDRALNPNPRAASDRALADPDFDLLQGAEPWGRELTSVFRAAFSELGPVTGEAFRVLPDTERMRAHARAMRVQNSELILPVISYAPLLESEWDAVLSRLNEVIELALLFEGAVVVWLIGGFYRDVEGRLTLHPQISLSPPQPGTRIKPMQILLGTSYLEQCTSLRSLLNAAQGQRPRRSDAVLAETPWHRVVVQLNVSEDDYVLLSLDRLSENEREVSRRVMYLEQQEREPHVLEGAVQAVPRPWRRSDADQARTSGTGAPETTVLPPRAALQAAGESALAEEPVELSLAEALRHDAEQLRRRGMSLADSEPVIAQKYLLASTVLDNSSVDVWLKLVELAVTERQRQMFQREAEKALKRQQQGQ